MRVLKPGGQIEILSVDAHMSCEGPKLAAWVDEHLSCRLEAHGLSKQASDTVLDTMEIVGYEKIRRARVALPAHVSVQDGGDMMAFLGRHFYQDLHGKLLRGEGGEEWFWARRDVREECERYGTKMVLTIACAQKGSGVVGVDGYLDL